MKRAAFLLVVFCGLGTAVARAADAPAAPAGKTSSLLGKRDTSQPINIAADKVTADLNAKTVTYSGNVVVVQGDIRMHADAMKVNTDNGKAQTIQANGNVVVDSPASGTATGDSAVYDVTPRTVTLSGKVVLTRAKDVMRGAKLTINLVTGQAVLGGQGGVQGTQGAQTGNGRVQGVFTPTGGN
jgi:lipopolysaccharide export system protein LptA